jgi:N-acetyl-gamma-glutamyl-phosphate reductase
MGTEQGKKIKVGIVGSTGYAGAELVRILCGHPHVDLTMLTSRQYANIRFDQVYPAMCGHVNLVCEELNLDRLISACQVIFMALPHKIPMSIVPELMAAKKQVIDLSADFRFHDADVYEKAYQPHDAPELLNQAVYGLSEVFYSEIQTANLIGNPGCYPTSALLATVPLLQADLIDPTTVIIDSKSGVSGAGRSLSLGTHYCQVNDSFKAYKVASHRHNPEINAIASQIAGIPVGMTFVPHLVPMGRGMLTTQYAHLKDHVTADDIRACLKDFYVERPFVRICPPGRLPETMHVKGTNYCDMGFELDEAQRRVILISAIDNLVKGAAGQAVQNMNIMCGLNEIDGLAQAPYPV